MMTMREVRDYWLFLLFAVGVGLLVLSQTGCSWFKDWKDVTRGALVGVYQTTEVVGGAAEAGYKVKCEGVAVTCRDKKDPVCEPLKKCQAERDGVVGKLNAIDQTVAAGFLALALGLPEASVQAKLDLALRLLGDLQKALQAAGILKGLIPSGTS